MYRPNIWIKPSGVPVLSRQDLDHIGEKILYDFCPEVMRKPQAVNIDLLVEEYLGMQLEFPYLSHNGVYLGMTVFYDTNSVPVYDAEHEQAEYMSVKGNTILIDRRLIAANQINRYRFTMGHEAGHAFLHREFFKREAKKELETGKANVPFLCRSEHMLTIQQAENEWTDREWLEWQANSLSSAILMPKTMVKELINDISYRVVEPESHVSFVMDTFQVSREAARRRLKHLGLGPKSPWHFPEAIDPHELRGTFPEKKAEEIQEKQVEILKAVPEEKPYWKILLEAEDLLPF